MGIYGYDSIDSNKLTTAFKDNECAIVLSKSRGKRCASLIDKLNKTILYEKASHSLLSRMMFLLTGLFEVLRVMVFNANLIEVLVFYYQNNPSFEIEELANGELIFRFARKI